MHPVHLHITACRDNRFPARQHAIDMFFLLQSAFHLILFPTGKRQCHVIRLNAVKLQRRNSNHGIPYAKAGYQQSRAAGNACYKHDQTLRIAESIAQGNLLQEGKTPPE